MAIEVTDLTGTVINRFYINDAATEVKFGETLPKGMYVLKPSCEKCPTQRLMKE